MGIFSFFGVYALSVGAFLGALLAFVVVFFLARRRRITLNGKDIWRLSAREMAKQTAVVLQEIPMEFDFTVEEMVRMGRTPHQGMFDRQTAKDRNIIREALDKVGMQEFRERSFLSLSGGEKQRVLVARALAQQAGFLILDEPTNHLDIRYQLELLALVKGLGSDKTCWWS